PLAPSPRGCLAKGPRSRRPAIGPHPIHRLSGGELVATWGRPKSAFADGTVEAIERNTGTKVPKRQVEGLALHAARDFYAFYDRPESVEAAASEKDLLVLSLDAKGIVMRTKDLREATRKAAENSGHKLYTRLSKGEKRPETHGP
ncbi:MAG TPA: hypothetical protein VMK12_03520, partial [Anaeromyxobacteraceae bacterium]|nr:hypothetical protein [Anaeromyxobacteraceae bacterium]